MALSFLGLSLAAPSVLYLWLVRRGAYVLLEPRLAAAGGALYLALYVGLALLLLKTGLLNEATAFWGMALAALLAAWAIRARVPGEGSEGVDPEEVRRLHWGYGRWALLAGALSWVPMNAFFLVLPGVHGLEVAATLKALLNLVMPILHFNGAIASLFVPVFVSALQKGKLGRAIWVGGVALTLPSLLFWLIGAFWGKGLVEWVYGGRYVEVAFVLKALGMLPLFAAWINTWGAVLRSLEKPSLVAFGYAFSALLTVALGVPLVFSMGLQGAVFAMTMAYAALSLILFVFASRLLGTFNEMRAGK
jgi:O-antigen/teichoic acid export membrane protein